MSSAESNISGSEGTAPATPDASRNDADVTPSLSEARHVTDLVTTVARERGSYFDSLLDVGCGGRPLAKWFAGAAFAEAPRRYVAVDIDASVIEKMTAQGQLAFPGFRAPFDLRSDLVIASDVLEYVPPNRAEAFVENCGKLAGKVLAISTLNVKHWTRSGLRAGHGHVGWVPDVVFNCFKSAEDPARLRHLLDVNAVQSIIAKALPSTEWEIHIWEAWPWEIRDVAADRTYRHYLKTFVIAVRRA